MQKIKITISLLLSFNALCSLRGQAATPPALALPKDGAHVPLRPCLSGTADDKAGPIFPIVFAVAVNTFYPQAPASASENRFLTMPYIGEEGKHAGEHFQVILIQGPHEPFTVGEKLASLPAADLVSPVYNFVRDDQAPDYCEAASLPAPDGKTEPAATVVRAGAWPSLWPAIQLLARVGSALLIILFAALIVRPDLAEKILERLSAWFTKSLSRIERLACAAGGSVKRVTEALYNSGIRSATEVFQARGRIRRRLVWAVTLALLLCMVPLTLGVETLLLMSRLGAVIDTEFGAAGGFLFNDSAERASPMIGLLTGVLHSLQHGGLMVVALGLACLEGLAGTFLFWGDDAGLSLTFPLRTMFKRRPVPFAVFVLLDVALAVVAGLAGANRPVDFPWWVPAILAALIGMTVPFIAAFSQHILIELAGAVLGPVLAFGVAVAVMGLFISMMAGWVLCWAALLLFVISVFVSAGCPCLLFFLFAGAAYLCGSAVERIMVQLGRLTGWNIPWREAAVAGSFLLAAYFVSR